MPTEAIADAIISNIEISNIKITKLATTIRKTYITLMNVEHL